MQVVIKMTEKNQVTNTSQKPLKLNHKGINPAEFDFVDIERRLKELKALEKSLLSELDKR